MKVFRADEAACAAADLGLDFTEPRSEYETDTCLIVCRRCPVQQRCLDFALADSALLGVWGGTTAAERRLLRRKRRRAAA